LTGVPPEEARLRLGDARLMLLFSPSLCADRDPLELLSLLIDEVDVVQVRVKGEDGGPSPARDLLEWTERVVSVVGDRALVLVNDRVDVCATLIRAGVAGVHVGHLDTPVDRVRDLLGPDPLVGLSTHSPTDVARAATLPVDDLGFGPVHPSSTKGHARGLGTQAAWIAAQAASVPVFPIGGIDAANAGELDPVGRACVGAGILAAADPLAAARAIREQLSS
jgi:thiamine-phosphate pyrophosphorylase